MKHKAQESGGRHHARIYFSAADWERIKQLSKAEDFENRETEWLAWKIRRLLRELEDGR